MLRGLSAGSPADGGQAPPHSRPRKRTDLGLHVRAKTESYATMTRTARAHRHLPVLPEPPISRPRTRGDCDDVPRPCPFVGCHYNLFLDVDRGTGSVRFAWPHLEPEQVPADRSCALDIADRGGATLEDVGELANVTRERIRQIESSACTAVRKMATFSGTAAAGLAEHVEGAPKPLAERPLGRNMGRSLWRSRHVAPLEESGSGAELPTRTPFFTQGENADALVCESVWEMFARDSNNRGYSCRSIQSIRASESLRGQRVREGMVMHGGRVLTPRLASVLAAYAESYAAGRKTTALEIANVIKTKGKTEQSRVHNVAHALSHLRRIGAIAEDGTPKILVATGSTSGAAAETNRGAS